MLSLGARELYKASDREAWHAAGNDYAFASDFQTQVEENVVEAIAEVLAGAVVGVEECSVFFGVVAEANPVPPP